MMETSPAPPPTEGDSALLIAIPGAEPVVGAMRLAHDAAAGRALTGHGPIVGRATHVALMTRGADGRWSVESQFALAEGR